MSDGTDDEWFEGTNIGWEIQNRIITIIEAGSAGGENIGLRPLRELIQNADDARADRVAIRIDDEAMTFVNDGFSMTRHTDQPGMGTVDAIMKIEGGSKKEQEKTSGNFGTGFRSCHLYSDEAEVVGEVIIDGTERKPMVAVCSPYTTEVDYSLRDRYVSLETRSDSERPKRSIEPGSAEERGGVRFRFPWRKEVTSKEASKEWEAMLWPQERIERLISEFVREIPRIIIGCRWIREAVLVLETGSTKGTHFWIRDFNIEEMLDGVDTTANIVHSVTSTAIDDSKMLVGDSSGESKKTTFAILTHRATGSDLRHAKAANYEPVCVILSPIHQDVEDDGVSLQQSSLPSYTPIALTGNSGEGFGPLSFLPPHESRTKIKIDDTMNSEKVVWASASLALFSSDLLRPLLEKHLNLIETSPTIFSGEKMLSQLPSKRPDMWFSDSSLAHNSRDLEVEWEKYTQWTTEKSFVPTNNGLVKPSDSVFIEGFEEEEREVIVRVLESTGLSVMDQSTSNLLGRLSKEFWGANHPLTQAKTVDDAVSLRNAINDSGEVLRLADLGDETASSFLEIVVINPSDVWSDSADRLGIPAIPDADGILRPLKSGDDYYFFESMRDIPDILPSSRRIHPDFTKMMEGVTLGIARSADIAKMVHEAVTGEPDKFDNLDGDDELLRQVSSAMVSIVTSDDFRINLVSEFRFIPCRVQGEVRVRRVNHVNDRVWGVDVIPGVWRSYCRKEFIFSDPPGKRDTLGLHDEIINRISWLEIHPEKESSREEVGERLMLHKVVSSEPGTNIIRSLIFGQTTEMAAFGKAPSMFDLDESGNPEIDNWIGRDLDDETRDEILETLLNLLSAKENLKTGWGNQSRSKVHGIRMLKDEDGAWQKIGDLCYELDSELSELFGKKAILGRHKELLGEDILTLPVGAAGGGGLGVMKRMGEENIIEKLNSLDGYKDETRATIVEMMLLSTQEWDLDELGDLEWIPRLDGEIVRPSEAIVPTPKMVELFGDDHPWFLNLEPAKLGSTEVESRAKEIGIMVEHSEQNMLLTALMGPEEPWAGLSGTALIETLTKIYRNPKEGSVAYTGTKIGRLPNSDGEWVDGSYVVPTADLEAISEVFPDSNVIDREVLGSKKSEEMAITWIVAPGMEEPGIGEIVQRLHDESKEEIPDREMLGHLWRIVSNRQGELSIINQVDSSVSPESMANLMVPHGEDGLCRIYEMAFVGKKSRKLVKGDSLAEVELLPAKHPLKAVLKDCFGAIDLEDVSDLDVMRIAKDSEDRGNSGPALERLWLAIAMVGVQDEELLEMPIWPYQTNDINGLSEAIAGRDCTALFPMKNDGKDVIDRMVSDGLPMFCLPREGALMEKIYQRLQSDRDGRVPFISTRSRMKIESSDGEEWQVLVKATENIMKALRALKIPHSTVRGVIVSKTEKRIDGKLYAKLVKGGREVFWKEDYNTPNVIASLSRENSVLSITVSTAKHNERTDEELMEAISEALSLTKGRGKLSELIRTEEEEWGEIDERIAGYTPSHPRPLIKEGIYSEMSPLLKRLYNCCQICRRQTPKNRKGEIQEGVVSLFKSKGKYSTKKVAYDLGNSLYLCPVHKSLHERSLLSIPEIDEAMAKIRKSPGTKQEVIEGLITVRGDITLRVLCFERPDEQGEMRDVEHIVTWKDEHADRFRDSLSQYLEAYG